jgi:hypothetical protein
VPIGWFGIFSELPKKSAQDNEYEKTSQVADHPSVDCSLQWLRESIGDLWRASREIAGYVGDSTAHEVWLSFGLRNEDLILPL